MWMENNTELGLVENRCKSTEWMNLAQDRIQRLVIVKKVITTLVPKKCVLFLDQLSKNRIL
jgi:hypothetical protein